MNWDSCFSQAALRARRSTVREFLKLTRRPGCISFAGGLPAPDLFPVQDVRAATERVLTEHPAAALQYGESEGLSELRDAIAARYPGTGYTAENVLITNGAQQGLDLVGRLLLEPGSLAWVQNPTYLACLLAWSSHGARFATWDQSGRQPTLAASDRAKVLYVIPNFQNPTGTTLTLPEREQVLALAARTHTPILEDDPYGELRFEGEPLPSLVQLDPRRVIHSNTFSKVLAPGLRIGWLLAPTPVIERLVRLKQGMDLHTSTFTQWVTLELLKAGTLERQIPKLRETYRQRRDVMLEALARAFPAGCHWTQPAGGLFIFVTLPEGTRAADLIPAALETGVAFVPGDDFHIDATGTNTLRLNFSHSTPAQIAEGTARLGSIVRGYTQLPRNLRMMERARFSPISA